ncbi:MAG: right-handed parallel beta-helix repeat-containing protein [Candidatus Eisenbacteria bacterium]|nr:right-handed parallel beta-helix repeat-containing protein [Candidatus Eisenbacteria bacterium]
MEFGRMTSNGAKRSHIRAAVLALLALLFHAMSGQARTWQVGHGSGEIDSLATACRLAESGDTILIAPGRYVADQGFPPKPMIYVHNRSLTILGGGSRAADVVLVRHRLFFKACERTELRGVTFESGESTFLSDGNVYVSDCEFNDVHGNAMVIGEVGRTAVIEDCVFRRNGAPVRQTPTDYGGAIWAETGVRTTRCQFYDNVAEERGGAIFTPGEIAIEDCLFVRNEAAEGAAVWMGSQAGSVVRSCTFYENSCRNNADAALHVAWANYETEVEQCLFVAPLDFPCEQAHRMT